MSREMDDAAYVGRTDEFNEEPTLVTVDGREIGVACVDGQVYLIRNICPHQQGPIGEGTIEKEENCIYCPWHGWKFDLDTGDNPIDDTKSVRTYEPIIEDGKVYVRL